MPNALGMCLMLYTPRRMGSQLKSNFHEAFMKLATAKCTALEMAQCTRASK